MRIQRIRGGRISNALPFGQRLRKVADEMVWPFSDRTGFGFQDGGCRMFATALRDWSGGALDLAAIYRRDRPGRVQHVVARFGTELFLDSDGAGTEADLLAKMAVTEGMPDPHMGEWVPESGRDIPYDEALVAELVQGLEQRLGAFDPAVLAPFEGRPEEVSAPRGP